MLRSRKREAPAFEEIDDRSMHKNTIEDKVQTTTSAQYYKTNKLWRSFLEDHPVITSEPSGHNKATYRAYLKMIAGYKPPYTQSGVKGIWAALCHQRALDDYPSMRKEYEDVAEYYESIKKKAPHNPHEPGELSMQNLSDLLTSNPEKTAEEMNEKLFVITGTFCGVRASAIASHIPWDGVTEVPGGCRLDIEHDKSFPNGRKAYIADHVDPALSGPAFMRRYKEAVVKDVGPVAKGKRLMHASVHTGRYKREKFQDTVVGEGQGNALLRKGLLRIGFTVEQAKEYTLQSLRYCGAKLMRLSGSSFEEIMVAMGWKTIQMAMKYSRISAFLRSRTFLVLAKFHRLENY